MTVRAEATRVIPVSCQEVLELVLDLERYRQADTKIGRVSRPIELDEHDEHDEGTTRYWDDAPSARLDTWQRPGHARLVERFGTRLTTIRLDLRETPRPTR
jgi:hypothetical protein